MLYDDYSLMAPVNNVYDLIMENELINAVDSRNEEEARTTSGADSRPPGDEGGVGDREKLLCDQTLTAIVDVLTKGPHCR